MPSVFFTRKIPRSGIERVQSRFDTEVWESEIPPSKEEIIQHAESCEGLVTLLSDPITSEVIESLPRLRVIAQYAVGYDNIDVAAATARGVIVTNTPGVLTETTADLTWSLIMAVSRRIVEADKYVRDGRWRVAWGPELLLGEDVYGATLGIIGLGRIGQAVARRAKGFDMRVLYHSRNRVDCEKDLGAELVTLDNLLSESDIVTLHVPLTQETHHMIGARELGLMKKGAYLINTSRGAVLDEGALYDALRSGHLGGAGLDVFAQEPTPPNNPILQLSNVVVAPHIGSASTRTRTVMAEMCATNLIAALSGERPPNIVNPEVL
ncbi:MAG: glyoxylate reductase [Candidatus Thorarchaeota archaeon]